MENIIDRKVSIAPMMDCTDRHFRYFIRLISKKTLLYTEMVTTPAILNGDINYHLGYSKEEHPLALQLGGSNPIDLGECSKIAQEMGFDEINLNVGCPSDRVQSGKFGVCLMKDPKLVAKCIQSMLKNTHLPVSVKCRIGVDDHDSLNHLINFVEIVSKAGCSIFIIHARKAWLKGLSPKENRNVPPLNYDYVKKVKEKFPHLQIVINGGIKTLEDINENLLTFDGVMIGREAYNNPMLLSNIDSSVYSELNNPLEEKEVLKNYYPYVENQLNHGQKLHHLTRHLMGLFIGIPGAKNWRKILSDPYSGYNGINLLKKALSFVQI